MKRSTFIITLLLIVLSQFVLRGIAQVKIRLAEPNPNAYKIFVPEEIVLDTANIRVLYRLEILHDTINHDVAKSNNIMILQLGNKIDKYWDYYKLKGDSVGKDEVNNKGNRSMEDIFGKTYVYTNGSLKEKIFFNYPKGKLTVTNSMLGPYLYEEDIPKINWKLEEGTKTILDYPCQKATCRLFGRNYTAWYTMLIPIFKGPWKFSGLPGLILQVEDDKNQISWTCIGIESTKWTDCIRFSKLDYIKTSKSDFLKSFNDYKRNPGVVVQSSGMVTSEIPEKALKARAYNPIELSE